MAGLPMQLQMMVKMVGGKVLHSALGDLAVNGACTETVGRAMYESESEKAAERPWPTLTVKEKRLWTQRASVAVLGFRKYLLNE